MYFKNYILLDILAVMSVLSYIGKQSNLLNSMTRPGGLYYSAMFVLPYTEILYKISYKAVAPIQNTFGIDFRSPEDSTTSFSFPDNRT